MSKRSLTWLRQRTNVEDLLDDGIENNSDLESFAATAQPNDDSRAGLTEAPLQAPHVESPKPEPEPEPAEADFFGAAIGVLIIGCGISLVVHPTGGSDLFGSIGILFGVALLIYSFYKPRK
jgi:hypothetical protein